MVLSIRSDATRVARCARGSADATLTARSTAAKAVHITDLRTALCAAHTAAGPACPTYATDPTITSGQTTIKAQHVIDLRNNVGGLE